MANVLLGVTGSVAAYRAADLARDLMREGHAVRVLLTRSAAQFVTPSLFEALTGQPCLVDTFEEPEPGRMAHIDWARWADVAVLAPATADSIVRLAQGRAEDMLGSSLLASTAPWVVAPAMNPQMYASDAVREAMSKLRARAAAIVEPTEGDVACGENGQGKLASIGAIAETVESVLVRCRLWEGCKVLVTSGPTREPLDSVRYLSNRSSGKMGSAVARAGLLMGAYVTVVAGPQSEPLPLGVKEVRVETAQQMLDAALAEAPGSHLIIGVAAVADHRPAVVFDGKRKRDGAYSLELEENPDVIAALAAAEPQALTVAFAAEVGEGTKEARRKLESKGVDAVALNYVAAIGQGMDADRNALTWVTDGSEEGSGPMSKLACALWLLEKAFNIRNTG
ncbi:MAG: bifunctional phosphopantothenoylcysteine decarboxylase/phosphopantothenate--cysteine ligase CoaBC [Fimbriimonadaceae bacterium]|nr:bifunctional phosphopantothenoylcysteine decarboxylase/phosphopantothenate--cysteine ligase CoaBC [Fimbriimonadaceae bacterium]